MTGRSAAGAHRPDPALETLRLGSPLTERVLARLGAPRWLWIALWALIPALIPVVLLGSLAAQGASDRVSSALDVIVRQLVLAYDVLLVLWGVGRLVAQARALAPELSRLTQEAEVPGRHARSDIVGPVALTTVVTLAGLIGWVVRFGPFVALLITPLFALTFLPIMTFVWTYLAVLVGLDRLGRERLELDVFPQDTSLGLAPVGSLAFTGLAIVLLGGLPIPVSNPRDVTTLGVSLVFLALSVLAFFLSMWRLHRQMAKARTRYVAEARAAYAEAYQPYRANRSLATLEAQAGVLATAQALLDRAQQVREWPIDQRLQRVLGFTVAAVASTIIGRFVLYAISGG